MAFMSGLGSPLIQWHLEGTFAQPLFYENAPKKIYFFTPWMQISIQFYGGFDLKKIELKI